MYEMNKDKSRFYRGKSYFIVILNASNYRKYKRNVLIYPFLTSNFIFGYSESDSVSESVSVSDSVSVLSFVARAANCNCRRSRWSASSSKRGTGVRWNFQDYQRGAGSNNRKRRWSNRPELWESFAWEGWPLIWLYSCYCSSMGGYLPSQAGG